MGVYQQAFTKETIISFILFHILIIVLALLPDLVISVWRYMRKNFHMRHCDSKGLQSNEKSKSKNNNDSVQTINISCTNYSSNETLEIKSSSGTEYLATYDNPSFESDIPKNLSNHSSKL